MSVNVGKLSAEEKEKMYSAATTEMEYRVELFNKSVPCDRPTGCRATGNLNLCCPNPPPSAVP